MINLLFCVVSLEAGAALLLMLQMPAILHIPLMWAIQLFNTGGRLSALPRTFAVTMALILAPTLYNIFTIHRRIAKLGAPTPADHFMLRTYLLEASLIGFSLFLAMVTSQLHSQLCEIGSLRSKVETLKKQAADAEEEYLHLKCEQIYPLGKEKESAYHEEINSLKTTVLNLNKKIEDLQMESQQKDEEVRAAEANAKALQKQSEGFLLEYDRLLEDNQNLHSQLASIDRRLSHSDSTKKRS